MASKGCDSAMANTVAPVAGQYYRVAFFLQALPQQLGHALLVFHHQDLHAIFYANVSI